MARIRSAIWLLVLVGVASDAAAERSSRVIPPGREEAVLSFLEPVTRGGFVGYESTAVQIDGSRIVVTLADGSPAADVPGCEVTADEGPTSFLEIRPAGAEGSERRLLAGWRQGEVERAGLVLSWSLCGSSSPHGLDESAARAEAARLLGELPAARVEEIWASPLPPGASHEPPLLPWLLFAALLVGSLLTSRRPKVSLFALALSFAGLAWGLAEWWHHPPAAWPWLLLPAIGAGCALAMSRDARGELLPFLVVSSVAFLVGLTAPSLAANWYVDVHGPADGASAAFVKNGGGVAFWPSLLDSVLTVDQDLLFLVNRIAFALAVAMLGITMRRLCREGSSPWPQDTWMVWVALLLTDGTMRWLGGSDAPHVLSLLSWSLGFFIYLELTRLPAGRTVARSVGAAALALCSALVGLTRLEQLLFPLAYLAVFLPHAGLDGLRRQRRAVVAVVIGVLAAAALALPRGALQHVASAPPAEDSLGIASLSSLLADFVDLPPLLPSPLALALLLAFGWLCLRRPGLLALPMSVALFEAIKVVGGFGVGGIGGPDPSQRYHVVVIPLLLLMVAAGAVHATQHILTLLRLGATSGRARAAWSEWGLVVVVAALSAGASRSGPLGDFQAEHRFLTAATLHIPRGSTVATASLDGTGSGHGGLEGPLALPHGGLAWHRRDLRWRVVEPGVHDPLDAEFVYLGSWCNARPEGGGHASHDRAGRAALIDETLELCRDLEARVESWLAVEEVTTRPMHPFLLPARVIYRLGRCGPRRADPSPREGPPSTRDDPGPRGRPPAVPLPDLVSRPAPGAGEEGVGPAEAEWNTVEVDLQEHFTEAEVESWAGRAREQRLVGHLALGLGLVFLLCLAGSPGRRLQGAAERLAGRLAGRAPFRSAPARRLASALTRLFGHDWAAALLFTWAYLVVGLLLALPLALWSEAIDQRAGLSTYSAGAWVWDLLKGEALTWVAFSLLVLGLFGLMRRLPRVWWIALGVPAALLLAGYGVLAPYQSRLYHDVRPLEDDDLADRLEDLARREGMELREVNVLEASRTTRAMGAYVTGEGPSRELVLFDTLLDNVAPEEVEVAVAHELYHERTRRPWRGHLLSAAGILALLAFFALVLRLARAPLRLEGPGDVRALPVLLLAASLAFLAARPIRLAQSRDAERRADRAALVATEDPEAFIELQVALARANRSELRPPDWVVAVHGTHPPVSERIGTALWYREWLEARGPAGATRPRR